MMEKGHQQLEEKEMKVAKWLAVVLSSGFIFVNSPSLAADQDVTRITYYSDAINQSEVSMTGYTFLGGYGVNKKYLVSTIKQKNQKVLATARKGGVVNIRYHRTQKNLGFRSDIDKVEIFYQGHKEGNAESVLASINYARNHVFDYADAFFDVPNTEAEDIRYWIEVTSRNGEVYQEPTQVLMLLPEACEFKIHFESPVNGKWPIPHASPFIDGGSTVCIDYDRGRLYALGLEDIWYRIGTIKPYALGWLEFKDAEDRLIARYQFSTELQWQFMIPSATDKIEAYFLGQELSGKHVWDSNFGKNFVFYVNRN